MGTKLTQLNVLVILLDYLLKLTCNLLTCHVSVKKTLN